MAKAGGSYYGKTVFREHGSQELEENNGFFLQARVYIQPAIHGQECGMHDYWQKHVCHAFA